MPLKLDNPATLPAPLGLYSHTVEVPAGGARLLKRVEFDCRTAGRAKAGIEVAALLAGDQAGTTATAPGCP